MFFRKKNTESSPAYIFVGLGNPGSEHERQRHNVGFMVADAIAEEHGFPMMKEKYEGHFAEAKINDTKVFLLKPQTYMNLSGQSVAKLARFYKVQPDHIFVFYDELDLPAGKVRIKKGGGDGGHNGIKSIDACMGKTDYWRVRIGIGHPGDKARVTGHVLGNFAPADQEWLPKLLTGMAQYCPLLLQGKNDEFMSRLAINSKE
ncbi:MAG: aminoacyl-tRNA hydrolase [Alphaproteobacteria bacterium]|nr:aminoacyl-tRNA hydrolase [Alphaproteobacteria bacterium]